MRTMKNHDRRHQVLDWAVKGKGNAVIESKQDSERTSVLIELSQAIIGLNVIFLSPNKQLVKELRSELSWKITCKTLQSVGISTIKSYLLDTKIQKTKYSEIAKPIAIAVLDNLWNEYQDRKKDWSKLKQKWQLRGPLEPPTLNVVTKEIERLVYYAMTNLIPIEDETALALAYTNRPSFPLRGSFPLLHQAAMLCFDEGMQAAHDLRVIDVEEVLWLPYHWGLKPKQYDFLLVDDADSLTPTQLDLILKMKHPDGGRIVFAGSSPQTLLNDGTSTNRIHDITDTINAVILSLNDTGVVHHDR